MAKEKNFISKDHPGNSRSLSLSGGNFQNSFGFTLIELLVVIAIMMIMATFLSINLAGRRSIRNLTIAQSELVSNLRKVESYVLSSRNLPNGSPVQYYVIKFDMSKPTQYTIEGIYNVSTSPILTDIETIYLPSGIQFAATHPITIDRPGIFTTQYPNCGLVGFQLPYEQIIANNGCSGGPNILASDDYGQIIYFQANAEPNSASADSDITFTLTDKNNTISKTVTISAVTGAVTFN